MVTDAMTTSLSGVLQPDISEKILGAFGRSAVALTFAGELLKTCQP